MTIPDNTEGLEAAPLDNVQPLRGGNIDLAHRPIVRNPDGSISTVRSMGINVDGHEVLIPTVAHDGSRVLSDKEAVDQYFKSGRHLGVFRTAEDSSRYAEALHNKQAEMYPNDAAPDPNAPQVSGAFLPPVDPRRAGAEAMARAAIQNTAMQVPGVGAAAAIAADKNARDAALKILKGNWNKTGKATAVATEAPLTDEQRKAMALNPLAQSAGGGEVNPTQWEAVPQAPARVIPGGLQLSSQSVQKGVDYSSAVEGNLANAEKSQADALRLGKEAAVEKATIEATSANKQYEDYQKNAASEDARHAKAQAAYTAQMAKADALEKAAAAKHVDPGGYFEEKGIGTRIGTAIAMAAGAFGSALTHSPNYAAEIINKSIEHYVESQKEARSEARDAAAKAGEKGKILGEGDLDAHQMYLAKLNEGLTVARLDVARQMANVNSKEAYAQLSQLDANLGEKAAANRASIEAQGKDRLSQSFVNKPAQVTGGGPSATDLKEVRSRTDYYVGRGYSPEDAQKMAMQMQGLIRVKGGGSPNFPAPPGKGGKASTAEELKAGITTNNLIDTAAASKGGLLGAAASHLPSGLPLIGKAVNEAKANKIARDEANVQLVANIERTWKAVTGGAPPKNKYFLENIAHKFQIEPGEDESIAKKKIVAANAAAIREAQAQMGQGGGSKPSSFQPAGESDSTPEE